jgi:ABC-type sugar transport system ATPase subunit
MKILAGAESADAGTICIDGHQAHLNDVRMANDQGIAIVFQELSVYPDLDVLANLFLRREPRRGLAVLRRRMAEQARSVLAPLGVDVDLRRPVGELRLADQQLIEIAKALLLDARILILDEPNSALNAAETARLFAVLRELRRRSTAIIYVSHRLEEVFEISDVVSVVRNGELVSTTTVAETTIPAVVRSMIGRDPTQLFARQRRGPAKDDGALRIEGLEVRGQVTGVDLTIRRGEVVGLAGLEGSGAVAVLEAVFGLRGITGGRMTLPGGASAGGDVVHAVRSGVAMVPADRRNQGLSLDMDVPANIAQVTVGALRRGSRLVRRRRLEHIARRHVAALDIRAASLSGPVHQLSGGNQQKVVIAKWLEAHPTVVLLNDPTRGVDIGAKAEIYGVIDRLAAQGRVVLFVSSELLEYVHLCDRVALFYRGRMTGVVDGGALTNEGLLEAINTGGVAA